MSIAELASSSVVFALLQPAPATFSCLSPADSLYVTVTFGPSVSESLFQVSFHWCSGLTAGHRESSLHPQRPTPPSLTSGNFYSCHMLSQMTQLSLQLPSLHSAPSSHLASRPSPIFLSPAAPVLEANLFFRRQDWFPNKLELSLHLSFKLQNLPRSSKTQSPPCPGLFFIGFLSPSMRRWPVLFSPVFQGRHPRSSSCKTFRQSMVTCPKGRVQLSTAP